MTSSEIYFVSLVGIAVCFFFMGFSVAYAIVAATTQNVGHDGEEDRS